MWSLYIRQMFSLRFQQQIVGKRRTERTHLEKKKLYPGGKRKIDPVTETQVFLVISFICFVSFGLLLFSFLWFKVTPVRSTSVSPQPQCNNYFEDLYKPSDGRVCLTDQESYKLELQQHLTSTPLPSALDFAENLEPVDLNTAFIEEDSSGSASLAWDYLDSATNQESPSLLNTAFREDPGKRVLPLPSADFLRQLDMMQSFSLEESSSEESSSVLQGETYLP